MLLNLTNHPSAQWGEAQKQSAQNQFGEIIDIAFPAISPKASTAEVLALAQDYIGKIETDYPQVKNIHLMGEMSFVFAFASLAHQKGWTCWVSTSERIAEEKEGKKITVFVFEQFRAYKQAEMYMVAHSWVDFGYYDVVVYPPEIMTKEELVKVLSKHDLTFCDQSGQSTQKEGVSRHSFSYVKV